MHRIGDKPRTRILWEGNYGVWGVLADAYSDGTPGEREDAYPMRDEEFDTPHGAPCPERLARLLRRDKWPEPFGMVERI